LQVEQTTTSVTPDPFNGARETALFVEATRLPESDDVIYIVSTGTNDV
jgi:hypothetical protein